MNFRTLQKSLFCSIDPKKSFEVSNISDRGIEIPSFNPLFTEFLGALAGDGHLSDSNHTYRIEFTLNGTEDKYYTEFLKSSFKFLFNIEARVYERESSANRIDVQAHSKKLHSYLSKYFPTGKKERLVLPEQVVSKEFESEYLRGLMDTDGSLFFAKRGTYERNSYPVIEFKLNDSKFLDQVENIIENLGINPYRASRNKIQINGKEKLEKWNSKIGFRNPNRLSRYCVWKVQNYCPPNTTLEQRLKMLGIKPG